MPTIGRLFESSYTPTVPAHSDAPYFFLLGNSEMGQRLIQGLRDFTAINPSIFLCSILLPPETTRSP